MDRLEIVNEVHRHIPFFRDKWETFCEMVEEYGENYERFYRKAKQDKRLKDSDAGPPRRGMIWHTSWEVGYVKVTMDSFWGPVDFFNPCLWFGKAGCMRASAPTPVTPEHSFLWDCVLLSIVHDHEDSLDHTEEKIYCDNPYKRKYFRRDDFSCDVWWEKKDDAARVQRAWDHVIASPEFQEWCTKAANKSQTKPPKNEAARAEHSNEPDSPLRFDSPDWEAPLKQRDVAYCEENFGPLASDFAELIEWVRETDRLFKKELSSFNYVPMPHDKVIVRLPPRDKVISGVKSREHAIAQVSKGTYRLVLRIHYSARRLKSEMERIAGKSASREFYWKLQHAFQFVDTTTFRRESGKTLDVFRHEYNGNADDIQSDYMGNLARNGKRKIDQIIETLDHWQEKLLLPRQEQGTKAGKKQPWRDSASDYMSNSEAIVGFTGSKMSLATLSKLLTPEGPIRYMRRGRWCKVHIGDFGEYAKKHYLPDELVAEVADEYCADIEARKKQERLRREREQD
jgi:hypothetical protein